jgi:hypothetical protein
MGRLLLVFGLTVTLMIAQGTAWIERSSEAQDPIVNCNQLEDQGDRCECNRRVLGALNEIKVVVSDPVQSANSTPANIQDAVQLERRHRLRTFIAPHCELASSPADLPVSDEHSSHSFLGKTIEARLQPLFTKTIEQINRDDPKKAPVKAKWFLEGYWEGWQTLADGKPRPIFFHIIEFVRPSFVRACSDHGMVFGVLRGGFVELPGPESSGLSYSIRLWRGGPTFRDLEGVALLDLRPNEEMVAGLVRLTRALKRQSSLMPTGYFCEGRELEDRRQKGREKGEWPPELKKSRRSNELEIID